MILALVAHSAVFAQSDDTEFRRSRAFAITFKTTPSQRVAFREHRGHYWSIGPQFTELHRYLMAQDLPGPMYARFLNKPGAVPVDALRTEVGFFVPEGFRPDESFRSDTHPSELVACMMLEEPSANRSHDLARLRAWIRENGYVTSGPVTEIYHIQGGVKGRETWRTEVQLPIVRLRAPQGLAGATSPKTAVIAERPQVKVESDLPRVDASFSTEPARPTPSAKTRTKAAPPLPVDSPPDRPNSTIPRSAPAAKPPGPAAVPSAQLLLSAGRFEELAGALMPNRAGSHSGDGVWRGQVALRTVAVARGIVQMYADRTAWAGNLAETLMTRFDTFVKHLPVDPRDQAIVTYDSQPESVVVAKRSIMRDLDRLLATVAGRAIDVDPGAHTFRFEAAGEPPIEQQLLVRVGEQNRPISVNFAPPEVEKPPVAKRQQGTQGKPRNLDPLAP
ncbi:MAG: GyrI-like domain-containing protein, partial [Planctomycetes bacterium]|nr:GyrI-like domain-containing protein [Planctomycetota bacterium]